MEKIGFFLMSVGLLCLVVGLAIFFDAYSMNTSVSLDMVPIGRLECELQVLWEQKRALEGKDPKPHIVNVHLMEKKKDAMALGYLFMGISGLMMLMGTGLCSADART